MLDKEKPIGTVEHKEQTPRPDLLDVININGRWAQAISDNIIRYIDNQAIEQINWDEYDHRQFVTKEGKNCGSVIDIYEGGLITKEQYSAIHWSASEQENEQDCRLWVTVFGTYTRKK